MVGITLTPEQLRSAPLDVRRWIERELAASLGLRPGEVSAAQPQPEHLVACTLEEAAAVLSLIQGMFPVVNVFFELGRQGASVGSEGLEAFRLADILRHTRLQNMSQVTAFLDIINQAVRRVRADPAATLYVLARDVFVSGPSRPEPYPTPKDNFVHRVFPFHRINERLCSYAYLYLYCGHPLHPSKAGNRRNRPDVCSRPC